MLPFSPRTQAGGVSAAYLDALRYFTLSDPHSPLGLPVKSGGREGRRASSGAGMLQQVFVSSLLLFQPINLLIFFKLTKPPCPQGSAHCDGVENTEWDKTPKPRDSIFLRWAHLAAGRGWCWAPQPPFLCRALAPWQGICTSACATWDCRAATRSRGGFPIK